MVFSVRDLRRTEAFYAALWGPPIARAEQTITFGAVGIRVSFTRSPLTHAYPTDQEQLVIDHLAFPIASLEELAAMATKITEAGIPHSGIQVECQTGNPFFSLSDPDGLRIEFYCETH